MDDIIRRIYVEKRKDFNSPAKELLGTLKENLGLETVKDLRILNRYDIEGIENDLYQESKTTIFSEPNVDILYEEKFPIANDEIAFGVEYIPGQYDQRADSAIQCIHILKKDSKPIINTAKIFVLKGASKKEINKIKKYIINPVDSREATLEKPESIDTKYEEPFEVMTLEGFIDREKLKTKDIKRNFNLVMSDEDIEFVREYFKNQEKTYNNRDKSTRYLLV